MRQVLSDVRVVEIGGGVAAGWCGKAFADLGADVVKVEPPDGDPLRADRGDVHAPAHQQAQRGRRDRARRRAGARAAPRRRRPRDRDARHPEPRRLGHRPRRRRSREQPATSVLAITGFGATGPYADYAWSDLVAQAFSGVAVLDRRGPVQAADVARRDRGRPHRRARAGSPRCSARVPPASARSSTARRRRRSRRRRSACRGTSAGSTPATPTLMDKAPSEQRHAAAARHLPVRRRLRGDDDDDAAARRDAHRARERRAARGVRAGPTRSCGPETKEILDGVLYPWLLDRTREEVTVAAQAAGWPVAPVLEPAEVLAADHLHQRGFWRDAVDDELGPVLLARRAVPAHRRRLGAAADRAAPGPARRAGPRTATSSHRRRRSRCAIPTCRRCAASACSTSPPCGRAPTSPRCSATSAPR